MPSTSMPKYKCHKEVHALKIRAVHHHAKRPGLSFEDQEYESIHVSPEYIEKHKPYAGGYYVIYEDGYQSFSPADAFESGYSRIE